MSSPVEILFMEFTGPDVVCYPFHRSRSRATDRLALVLDLGIYNTICMRLAIFVFFCHTQM